MPDYIRQRERRTGWLLTIPALLILLLIYAYPIISAFVMSLFTENLSTNLEPTFNWLQQLQPHGPGWSILAEPLEYGHLHRPSPWWLSWCWA